VAQKNHVRLIINDRVDIALALSADGVHVGQSDLPSEIARRLLAETQSSEFQLITLSK
jgi:thiamine-phosphate pyrophosphorylase